MNMHREINHNQSNIKNTILYFLSVDYMNDRVSLCICDCTSL